MVRSKLLSTMLSFAFGVAGVSALAQGDSSLTRDFERLSAKERSRIAQQENADAALDAAFGAVMQEAESLFAQKRYDEALVRYTDARRMRPYNVYPKVKIQDLQALIAKRDAELKTQEPSAIPPETAPEVPAVVEIPQPAPAPVIGSAPPIALPPPEVTPDPVRVPVEAPTIRVAESRPVHVSPSTPSLRPPEKDPAPDLENGLHERIYKEGRAVVLERTVVSEGKGVVYKKVTHPWGEVVHFRDGLVVPPRVWSEAFAD